VSIAVSKPHCIRLAAPVPPSWLRAYLDRTCVVRVEVDYGLAAASNLDLVLRAESRHDCVVLRSVCLRLNVSALVAWWRTFDCVTASPMLATSHRAHCQDYLRHGCCTVQHSGPAAALCLLGSLFAVASLPARGELLLWYRHVSLDSARGRAR
jgi:hypothetical protein